MIRGQKLSSKVKLVGVAPGTKEYKNLARRVRGMEKRGYIFSKNIPVSANTNLYEVSAYVDPISGQFIKGTVRHQQEKSISSRKGWETRRKNALQEEPQLVKTLPTDLGKILAEIQRKIQDWEPYTEWVNPRTKDENYKTSAFTKLKERDKDKLKAMLNLAIATEGKQAVAARLEANAEEANVLATQILYGGSGDRTDFNYMQGELAAFSQIILGRHLSTAEQIELEQQIESFMPA